MWKSAVDGGEYHGRKKGFDAEDGFFTFAARVLGLSDIYSDVCQKVKCKDIQKGSVQVSFCEDQLKAVADSINAARNAGASFGDIAILVRGRKQGSDIASFLISAGIPVISDDSLALKSSLVVRRLVSLLESIENPGNRIGSFLAEELQLTMPEEYHSLVDLSESLLRAIRDSEPESFEGETLFVQAFMDEISSWTSVNGNNLRYFLKHWEDSNPCIGSPENMSSVRILTVHKSKGLEFPYVIFPFADKVTLYKNGVHWCHLDGCIYPVDLGSSSAETLFAEDYEAERRKQAVDNINLFYVALTRAVKGLHIIAKPPTKKCRTSLEKGKPEYGNFSEILFDYAGRFDDRVFGEMYDFSKAEKKEESLSENFPAGYPSYPLGDRLLPSEEASDFFGADGLTGAAASRRRYGIALHYILSKVERPSDLPSAVDLAVSGGKLSAGEGEAVLALLSERLASHPDWFRVDAAPGSVRNERMVYGGDGRENRPDRVVIGENETLIVDFKFGEERDDSYLKQISRYVALYRKMGYPDVRGFLWYVVEDEVIPL